MEFLSLSHRRSSSQNVPQRRWARRNVCCAQASPGLISASLWYEFRLHSPYCRYDMEIYQPLKVARGNCHGPPGVARSPAKTLFSVTEWMLRSLIEMEIPKYWKGKWEITYYTWLIAMALTWKVSWTCTIVVDLCFICRNLWGPLLVARKNTISLLLIWENFHFIFRVPNYLFLLAQKLPLV